MTHELPAGGGPAPDLSDTEALAAEFRSEADLAHARPAARTRATAWLAAGALVVLMGVVAAVAAGLGGAADATLRIESEPSGAAVRVDGEVRGATPLILALPAGSYSVTVGDGERASQRRITLAASERASIHHVAPMLAPGGGASAAASAAPSRTSLAVITEPPGGVVTLDGVAHGVAPVVISGTAPGEHQLVVQNRGTVYRRTVVLTPDSPSTVVVGPAPAPAAGWLTVRAPLALEIREDGRLLGTSAVERLMLQAGTHQLEFSDATVGFRASRAVRIEPGATSAVVLDLPQAPVNVNATPWGEVWIDGERVGETPIGNHMLTVGEHRIEVRHPELGTKQSRILVAFGRPNRLSVNMRER
jgi:hypothetical protein